MKRDLLIVVFAVGLFAAMLLAIFFSIYSTTSFSDDSLAGITGLQIAGSSIIRSITPKTVSPDGEASVMILINLGNSEKSWTIEETVPQGWEIIDPGSPSGETTNPRELRWTKSSDSTLPDTTITYKVKAPSAQSAYTFSGSYLLDTFSGDTPITGDSLVQVKDTCVPGDELCDGVDNDCDGDIDEGFNVEDCRQLCEKNGYEWTGYGAIDPALNCCGNDPGEDSPFEQEFAGASLALCDGRDNDCSGTTDEGFSTDDCARTCLDNGGEDYDPARAETRKCCGDHPNAPYFEARTYENPERTCDDGRDNDCDGKIDDADPNCAECVTASDCGLDNNPCNGIEACIEGKCNVSDVIGTDDNIDCTSDTCNTITGEVSHTPVDDVCLDGLWCNGHEYCDASQGCLTIPLEDPQPLTCAVAICDEGPSRQDDEGSWFFDTSDCECTTASECDDQNVCTEDTCDTSGSCVNTQLTGPSCDDTFFCTVEDSCNNGVCTGSERDASDGFDCTIDSCNENKNIIEHFPDDASCEDGIFCNGIEVCSVTEGCIHTTALDPSDGIDCTKDTCDEDNDRILHEPINLLCDDGRWCNGFETCEAGYGCRNGAVPSCYDDTSCSIDSCTEGTIVYDNTGDCIHDFTPCPCASDEECNDDNQCTDDVCKFGKCANIANDDNSCDDGFYCTISDRCESGMCVSDPIATDDGIACTQDGCNEDLKKVFHVLDNSACDNGLFCDGAEECTSSGCVDGTPPAKDDGILCTIEECDEEKDIVSQVPDDSYCWDGKFCNGVESCDLVYGCVTGTAPICDDGRTCSTDTCSEGTNTTDNIGSCIHNTEDCTCEKDSECSDSNACTDDRCVEGKCTFLVNDTNTCDDSQWCTENDRCVSGTCEGDPKNPSDGNECTNDVCDEMLDKFKHTPSNADCNDGKYCNGVEVCDAQLGCVDGTPPVCNDNKECTKDSCFELLNACISSPIDFDGDSYDLCNSANLDCNDNDPGIYPGADEDCDNDEDDDCDGLIDDEDPECFSCTGNETRLCPRQSGVCIGSIENCTSSGSWAGCTNDLYLLWNSSYQSNETNLTDGLDNDCDGIIEVYSNHTNLTQDNITNQTTNQTTNITCIEDWIIGDWSGCDDLGYKNRTVIDQNNCNTTGNKPDTIEFCEIEPSCYDNIMNGDEEGIDCGGTCNLMCEELNTTLVEEPETIAITITADQITAEILQEIPFHFQVENNGEKSVSGLTISLSKWSKTTKDITELLPGEVADIELPIRLPENSGSMTLEIRVLQTGVLIASKTVNAVIKVPPLSVRLEGDPDTGDVYKTILIDNRQGGTREIVSETTISKGKEIYYFDIQTHQLSPGKVYHQTEKLSGLAKKKGEYDIETRFLEKGDEIGVKKNVMEVKAGREAFNASLIFYFILIGIVCFTGYIFYTTMIKR